MEVLHLAGALMEHFFEGIDTLTQMRRVTITNLLFFNFTNALTEHFIQENVLLRHLLNAEPPFMS